MKMLTKIGDIFSVKIDDNNKKFFQYIISDLTQLNSDVIRAFKTIYPINTNPALEEIVTGQIEFYAHCVTKLGIKMGCWEEVGNISNVGEIDKIIFRDSGDYGNSEIKISQDWWIWKINEKQKRVGKLIGDYRKAEIRIIVTPIDIVDRMKTGRYYFFYPEFE